MGLFKFIFLAFRSHKPRSPSHRPITNYSPVYKTKAQSESRVKSQIQNFPLATVKWVIDGDTVILAKGWNEVVIRLDSIDCPENGQYWGDIAKYGLIKIIGRRKVHFEEHGLDCHGRTLATIYIRNYISKNLVTGTKDKNEDGWRLPAPEIENLIAQMAQQILDDHPAITQSLREFDVDFINIPGALKAAAAQSKRLGFAEDRTEVLSRTVQRIDLGKNGIRLTLLLASMIKQGDESGTVLCPTITHEIPVHIQRRGVEMKLVISGGEAPRVDPVLVKAVARARVWFDELQSGVAKSVRDIAGRYDVSEGYVGHLLPLAFLAPDIVEAIVAGQQPAGLTADALIKRINLPVDWSEQRCVLGFN